MDCKGTAFFLIGQRISEKSVGGTHFYDKAFVISQKSAIFAI